MKIELTKPVEKTVRPAEVKTFTEVVIDRLVDIPSEKTVKAFINDFGPITLWEGADYDKIGQWSDSDVTARITVLFA